MAAVVALGVAASGCGSDGSSSAELPPIVVRSLGGSTESTLDELSGTALVVNLWAPWCPPCRAEMPDFDSVARARGEEVRIVGLATGTEEAAAVDYAAEIGVSYELIYDVDDAALSELGIAGLPSTLFVDEAGTVVETHSGVLTATQLDTKITELLTP